jgi:hypothetical protein
MKERIKNNYGSCWKELANPRRSHAKHSSTRTILQYKVLAKVEGSYLHGGAGLVNFYLPLTLVA